MWTCQLTLIEILIALLKKDVEMKQLAKKMLLVALVAGCSSVSAGDAFDFDCMSPVIGIDYQQRWMNREEGFHRFFGHRNTFPGGNIYVGTRWGCTGLELGYTFSGRNKRNFSNVSGTIDGVAFAGVSGNVNTQLQGAYLDLLAYVPVMDCSEVFFGMGIGLMNARYRVEFNGTPPIASRFNGGNNGKTSGVGRARLGFNYLFADCIGARAFINYETTGGLRASRHTFANGNTFVLKPFQDSVSLGAGLFYKF